MPNRESNEISLLLISKGNAPLEEGSPSVHFDSDKVIVTNSSLGKTLSSQEYTLWVLNVKLSIPDLESTETDLKVNSITINDVTYEQFGFLQFQIIKGENSYEYPLNVRSETAASLGLQLADYHVSFRNDASETVYITDVILPQYECASFRSRVGSPPLDPSKGLAVKGGVEYDLRETPVPVLPGQQVDMTIDLSNCAVEGVNIHFVSPIVQYTLGEKPYQVAMFHYTSGSQPTEKELLQLGKVLHW